MTTPTELQALHATWEPVAKPDTVPEAAFRLWLTSHALVNRRIPIPQAAYLHAEANLYGRQYTWEDLCAEYDRTLQALREIDQPRMLHHMWLALHGWECYDPTDDAREANRKAKIDRYQRESILSRLVRAWMLEKTKPRG